MAKHNFDYRKDRFDVAIVGAGPVGLGLAIRLRELSLSVLLLDQRAHPEHDPGLRRQLLVARSADLSDLLDLGVDIEGDTAVPLHTMVRHNGVTGYSVTVAPPAGGPQALVPIGRLQRVLLTLAEGAGVRVAYRAHVTRVLRHARNVSILLASGESVQATMAFIATGAGRALVPGVDVLSGPTRRMIGGVFPYTDRAGTWLRADFVTPGYHQPIRYTALFGGGAGTALIVDGPLGHAHGDTELGRFFTLAKDHAKIRCSGYLASPQVFTTSVSSLAERTSSGDGRAPIVMVGDAAQTGHVFTGQVGLTNVAVAIELADALAAAADDIADGKLRFPHLARALARYEKIGERAAATLRRASELHFEPNRHGWALGFQPPPVAGSGAKKAVRLPRVTRSSERLTPHPAGPLRRRMGRPGLFHGGCRRQPVAPDGPPTRSRSRCVRVSLCTHASRDPEPQAAHLRDLLAPAALRQPGSDLPDLPSPFAPAALRQPGSDLPFSRLMSSISNCALERMRHRTGIDSKGKTDDGLARRRLHPSRRDKLVASM